MHDQWRDNPNGADDRRRDDPRAAAWTTDGVVTGVCGAWMTGGVACVHDQWRDNPNGVDDRRRDDPRVAAWTTDGVTTGVRGVWTTGGVTYRDDQWHGDRMCGVDDRRYCECG